MRFSLCSLPATLICLSLATSTTFAEEKALHELFAASDETTTVVCLGDSVTGVYYHTGGRRAYSAMVQIGLRRAFPDAKINVINAGISGNTTVDGLNRLQRDVLDRKPDLVTIMFSLNDMTRVPLADFEANLKNIVRQVQGTGSAVLLCTPNNVFDSPDRPIVKLEQYVDRIRAVAQELQLPLADCYAAYEELRHQDEWDWTMRMSDDIHPNMGGHKLIAETIVNSISPQAVSLDDVEPLTPWLPHTIKKLKAGETVHVMAMPPYDQIVGDIIRETFPEARLNLQQWPVEGLSLARLDSSAEQIRPLKPDWVIIAPPRSVLPGQDAAELRHLSWVLNKSLSFGRSEWDCLVVSPSLQDNAETEDEKQREQILHQFVRHQDLPLLVRNEQDTADVTAADLFRQWWQQAVSQHK